MRFAILLMLISTAGYSKSFNCENDVDTNIKLISSFDSTAPALESKTIFYNANGTIKSVKQKVYLSSNSACGVDVNFKSDCSINEKENDLGYSFNFSCSKQKLKGNFYIDENGFAQLQCSNQENPLMFCY